MYLSLSFLLFIRAVFCCFIIILCLCHLLCFAIVLSDTTKLLFSAYYRSCFLPNCSIFIFVDSLISCFLLSYLFVFSYLSFSVLFLLSLLSISYFPSILCLVFLCCLLLSFILLYFSSLFPVTIVWFSFFPFLSSYLFNCFLCYSLTSIFLHSLFILLLFSSFCLFLSSLLSSTYSSSFFLSL